MGIINNGVLDGVRRVPGKFRDLVVEGSLPGAPLGFRLRGATKSGPPVTGTWKAGDVVRDRSGSAWTCTAGGTPGAWSGSVVSLAPSGDVSGATDAAAISAAASALPASGGRVVLAAGQWYVQCGQVSVGRSGVYFQGAGKWATFVNATGAGDVFRLFDSSTYGTRTVHGGGIAAMNIDGTATTGNSTGIHAGDILQLQWDVAVSNFNAGTTSAGVKFDNQWAISEQMQGLLYASNCTTLVEFTQTPASGNTFCYGSFERANLVINLNQGSAAYNGITVAAGSYLNNSHLGVYGNFGSTSAGAVTSAVFNLTGSTPSGSQDGTAGAVPSNISAVTVDVGVECASGTFTPTTFAIASGCYAGPLSGNLNFGAAGNTFTPTTGIVNFFGLTSGDPAIVAQTGQAWLFQGQFATGTYASPAALASSGTIATTASWAIVAPTAAVTGVILGPGAWDGQFLSVLNTSAFTVTMAASGTSHVVGGTSEVIQPTSLRTYQWSAYASLWCPSAASPGAPVSLPAGTATAAPLNFQSGTLLTTAAAGAVEFDGVSTYITNDTTSGRGQNVVEQKLRLTAAGSTISTIANYFGSTSNIPLVSGAEYEIEIDAWFLKTTTNAITWTFTNSAAPTSMNLEYKLSPASGIASTAAATDLFGEQYNITTAAATVTTGSLTTAVNHHHKFWIRLINGTGTSLKIQATALTSGSITPGIGSYWKARRVPAANVGTFAA